MAIINWRVSKADADLIRDISQRAEVTYPDTFNTMDLVMDLTATHANGNPLDLAALLAFPPFDFVHDLAGIARHIDRDTGKLTGHFVPRCTRREPPTDAEQARAYADALIERARQES